MSSTIPRSIDDWKCSHIEKRREEGDAEMKAAVEYTLSHHKAPKVITPVLPGGDPSNTGTSLPVDWTPKNLPFHAGCECCFAQYFPVTHEVPDEEAQTAVDMLVENARRDIEFLAQFLKKHADLVVSRWKNKSKKDRLEFLSGIGIYKEKYAPIYLVHRRSSFGNCEEIRRLIYHQARRGVPIKEDFIQSLHAANVRKDAESYKYTWTMPYLNAEMLAEDPHLLLSLLYNRTAYEPEKWVLFDDWNMELAERFGIVKQLFNPHCVVMAGSDFGKLVKWDMDKAHRYEVVGFAKAYNILVAQQNIMRFLRSWVEKLFTTTTDLPVSETHTKWQKMIESSFSLAQQTSIWSTESIKPFSGPPELDVGDISDLVQSRHALLQDDLYQLQTDPSHLQEQVRYLTSAGWFDKDAEWDCVLELLIRNPLRRERMWDLLEERCKWMVSVSKASEEPSVIPRSVLDTAIARVGHFCLEMFTLFKQDVLKALVFQQRLDGNHKIHSQGNAKMCYSDDGFPDDLLYWGICTIGNDPWRIHTVDPSLNFQVIDDICKNAKQAGRITQDMLNLLSDMEVLRSVFQSIQLRHNQSRVYTTKNTDMSSKSWQKFCRIHQTLVDDDLTSKAAPKLRQFCMDLKWPTGRKDQKWNDQAINCCHALRRFWEGFECVWAQKLLEQGLPEDSIAEVLSVIGAAKSDSSLDDVRATIGDRTTRDHAALQVHQVQTVWGEDNDTPTQLPLRNLKKRRNGKAPEESEERLEQEVQDVPSEVAPLVQIYMRPESLEIFEHMYPGSGSESQKRIRWDRLLNAMVDAGFFITQSGGSAVTFTLGAAHSHTENRAITFHRPHPHPELHSRHLRNMGRRLERQFGWQRGSFALRGVDGHE